MSQACLWWAVVVFTNAYVLTYSLGFRLGDFRGGRPLRPVAIGGGPGVGGAGGGGAGAAGGGPGRRGGGGGGAPDAGGRGRVGPGTPGASTGIIVVGFVQKVPFEQQINVFGMQPETKTKLTEIAKKPFC